MQKAFAQFGSRTITSKNDVTDAHGPSRYHKYLMPASALAFLLAVVISMLVARSMAQVQNHSVEEQPVITESTVEQNASQKTSEATNEQSTSVNTSASIDNGQASVNVKVNGQETQVAPGESVHRTVTNNGTTTTIDVQNNSTTSGDAHHFSHNNTNTSSFSTNIQSFSGSSSQH